MDSQLTLIRISAASNVVSFSVGFTVHHHVPVS